MLSNLAYRSPGILTYKKTAVAEKDTGQDLRKQVYKVARTLRNSPHGFADPVPMLDVPTSLLDVKCPPCITFSISRPFFWVSIKEKTDWFVGQNKEL